MAVNMQIGSNRLSMKRQIGFTFIGLMAIISISGIVLAAVGVVWGQDAQRNKEQELLFAGDAYQLAITSYYESSPNGVKQFPQKLQDLVLDKRFPIVKRHIRKLYANPFSKDRTWELILQQGRIKGVTTASSLTPIKKSGFPTQYQQFSMAQTYHDWQFAAQ